MTNQIAIGLGAFIVICLGIDAVLFDWNYSLFLAKKFWTFMEWVAFWR